MASVLFVAPADLGETVLATGALTHVLREGDALTVLAGPEAGALFRAAPVARLAMPERGGPLWALASRIAGKHFDTAIDARGGWIGKLAPAARRAALEPAATLRHRVEDWSEALAAPSPLAPKLWLDAAARDAAASAAGEAKQILVLAPGGANATKRWPAECFAAVARRLATGPMTGAVILVVSAAARDGDVAREIVSSLDADGLAARDVGAALDLLGAAALMERATFVLGNDNALTHVAAAMGAPTLTLFGPTDERVRAPYGPRGRTLRGRSLEDLAAAGALDAGRAMEDVSIDAVEGAALDLLHAGGLR
jgi:lipopolysaccharide export system permease protein